MRSLALVLTLVLASTLQAQSVTTSHADWSRVQALKPGTRILLNASTRHGGCTIQTVTADALTCSSGAHPNVLRTEIHVIKLPHRYRSAVIGLSVGAGAGAIAGYATAGPDNGGLKILPRGDLAIIFAVPIAIVGAIIGFFTDFARTTFYSSN